MLYLIYGNDTPLVLESRDSLLKKYSKGSEVIYVTEEEFSLQNLKHQTESQGLFSNRIVLVLNNVLSDFSFIKSELEALKEVQESENIFIFIEESISLTSLKKIKIYTDGVYECISKKEKDLNKFNIFSITDSIIARDKKKSWLLYQEALKSSSPEEIAGIIFWAVKTLALVVLGDPKDSKSINPYVLGKISSKAKLWNKKEVEMVLHDLVFLTQKARNENFDLSISLEHLILTKV